MSWYIWLLIQVLIGIPLVVVPVFLKGSISLAITIPLYMLIIALTQVRDARQRKYRKRAPLISKLRAMVSHFKKLTEGAHTASVWAILRDLLSNSDFRDQMQFTGNSQAGELLVNRCQSLFSAVGRLHDHAECLTQNYSDKEIKDVINTTRQLTMEYRSIVEQFLRFLSDTKRSNGVQIQNQAPFSLRVHDNLADDYDRLLEDARLFGIESLDLMGIEFLKDEHLTRFRRATILR